MRRTATFIIMVAFLLTGMFVRAEAVESTGYTISLPESRKGIVGETVMIPVVIGSSGSATKYNAVDISISYDPLFLELLSTTIDGYTIETQNKTIHIVGYGRDRAIDRTAFTLSFRIKTSGESKVRIENAKIDISSHAISYNAPDAVILNSITDITAGGFPVTLPDGFSGMAFCAEGVDYTFTKPDDGREYYVIAKVNGKKVELKENGDGSFTVFGKDITGPLLITAYKKAAQDNKGNSKRNGGKVSDGEEVNLNRVWVIPYVELNGKTVFMIAVTGDPGKNNTYVFDGEPMYYTEKYASSTAVIGEKAYVSLIIAEQGEALIQSDVVKRVSIVEAEPNLLTYSFDVNASGKMDNNDAMMVYEVYNGIYWGFDELPCQRFFNADTNLDGTVNVADAAAIIALID